MINYNQLPVWLPSYLRQSD